MLCDKSEEAIRYYQIDKYDAESPAVNLVRICQAIEPFPMASYGEAITYVGLTADGEMWASNREYATRVNFCPACGIKAPKQYYEPPAQE